MAETGRTDRGGGHLDVRDLRDFSWLKLPDQERVRGELRMARARGMTMAVAAVVGIFAGIAAGLFAHAIRFAQILFFRGNEVLADLFSVGRRDWAAQFWQNLEHARWHFEFAGLSALGLAFAFVLDWLRPRLPARFSRLEASRVRSIVIAGSFGLALYYPLLLLATFNETFQIREGGMVALALAAPLWTRLFAPVIGAIAASVLVRYVSPESGGHGVVEVIEAVHSKKPLRGRVAVWKSLAAGLVIGSGGSAGREGPVVHLGGAVASRLCRVLGLPRRDTTLLLACGAGAGIAASFNAPLAGAMFALEIVLGDFGAQRFAPIVLACVTATATSHALLGDIAELSPITWSLRHGWEIFAFLVLGIVAGFVGILYVRSLHFAEELFAGKKSGSLSALLGRLNIIQRAALGALCVGLLGLVSPRVLGTGLETMNASLAGQLMLGTLLASLGLKFIATACTLGSGSPGGSFFPAVFLGAMLGGAFGHVIDQLAPGSGAAAYAAVGMGAVVAGATVAPLTGAMMVFELTSSSQIILPLLVSCGAAAAIVHWRLGGSLYALGARRRGVRLPVSGSALADLDVSQALQPALSVPFDLPRAELLKLVMSSGPGSHPVVDASGRGIGLLIPREARRALLDPALSATATARDLMQQSDITCGPDEDLDEALQRLTQAGVSEALVTDRPSGRPLGVISREGILDTWRKSAAPAPLHA